MWRLGEQSGGLLPETDEQLVPALSEDLINRLDKVYPPRVKALGESEEEHQRYAGIRTLIDELIGRLEEQRNDET